MYPDQMAEIQALLSALNDAVDEKSKIDARIITLNKELRYQLSAVTTVIKKELLPLDKKVHPVPKIVKSMKFTPFQFLYFEDRRLDRADYHAKITIKPLDAFMFLWRSSEPKDVIVVKKDNQYHEYVYNAEIHNCKGRIINNMTWCYNNFIRLLRIYDYYAYVQPDVSPLFLSDAPKR